MRPAEVDHLIGDRVEGQGAAGLGADDRASRQLIRLMVDADLKLLSRGG